MFARGRAGMGPADMDAGPVDTCAAHVYLQPKLYMRRMDMIGRCCQGRCSRRRHELTVAPDALGSRLQALPVRDERWANPGEQVCRIWWWWRWRSELLSRSSLQ